MPSRTVPSERGRPGCVLRKEDAWERFHHRRWEGRDIWCTGRGGGLGLLRRREELRFCSPWRRPSLLSLFSCVQGILCHSPGTDVVRSVYIVVGQKHHPVQACLCWVSVVHRVPLRLSWKRRAVPGACCPARGAATLGAASFSWVVGPPGWGLLSQACSCSPSTCCFSPALHPPLLQRAWW